MKLVLIGAENYTCIPVQMDPIKRGQTVDVDPQIGEHLKKQVYRDIANNDHPYFVEPSDPRAARYVTEEEAAPKAKPKRRARKKVAPAPAPETATEE